LDQKHLKGVSHEICQGRQNYQFLDVPFRMCQKGRIQILHRTAAFNLHTIIRQDKIGQNGYFSFINCHVAVKPVLVIREALGMALLYQFSSIAAVGVPL
jgi:hypothetical protein